MRFATRTTFALLFSASFLGSTRRTRVSGQNVDPRCDFGPEGVNLSLAFTNVNGKAPQTCFDFEGTERCYYTYIPASCGASSRKVPLVVDNHGINLCPGSVVQYTGWVQKAEEECFVVMMPSSSMDPRFRDSCFNVEGLAVDSTFGQPDGNNVATGPCCCADETVPPGLFDYYETPDDTAFVKTAIEDALARFPNENTGLVLDPTRVYMAGHSNGCMLSMAVAAKFSETVAAVCCHAGAVITSFDQPGYSPVPIWMVSGRQDALIPYEGFSLPTIGVGIWSHSTTYSYLLGVNGCNLSGISTIEDEATGEPVGSTMSGGGCTNGAAVEFVTLDESGHVVYPGTFDPSFGGKDTTIDTTGLAWEFCSAYAKPTPSPTDSPTEAPTTKSEKKSSKSAKSSKKAGKGKKAKSVKSSKN